MWRGISGGLPTGCARPKSRRRLGRLARTGHLRLSAGGFAAQAVHCVQGRRLRLVLAVTAPFDPLEEVYRAGAGGPGLIPVDALGAANVVGLFMPSPYTSQESREDVAELASRLRIEVRTIPITDV